MDSDIASPNNSPSSGLRNCCNVRRNLRCSRIPQNEQFPPTGVNSARKSGFPALCSPCRRADNIKSCSSSGNNSITNKISPVTLFFTVREAYLFLFVYLFFSHFTNPKDQSPLIFANLKHQSPLVLNSRPQSLLTFANSKPQSPLIFGNLKHQSPLVLNSRPQSLLIFANSKPQSPLIFGKPKHQSPVIFANLKHQSPLVLNSKPQSPLILRTLSHSLLSFLRTLNTSLLSFLRSLNTSLRANQSWQFFPLKPQMFCYR